MITLTMAKYEIALLYRLLEKNAKHNAELNDLVDSFYVFCTLQHIDTSL